ncbi:hypothetical protein [Mycobacterium sp. 1245801.1]|uniref:hypothetical protein n=1 Tax=Mycobacterium sp. 1245801.1 TaxID=1834075 RepID=UPI000800CEE2|nr:hypothetical protein [Mycobacterium sp. 1245801.1]OBJ15567.1 hypothetical protein A5622_26605 [Mycobacterium sp. 1245801.1]
MRPEPSSNDPVTMIQGFTDGNGLTEYRIAGEVAARREPGWYTPADDGVIVEMGECTIRQRGGIRIPITVRDAYDRDYAHSFIATNIRSQDGGDTLRYGKQIIIKCPDRPAVGYWRKVEGIQD